MARLSLNAHSSSMLSWKARMHLASQLMQASPKVRTTMITKSKEGKLIYSNVKIQIVTLLHPIANSPSRAPAQRMTAVRRQDRISVYVKQSVDRAANAQCRLNR